MDLKIQEFRKKAGITQSKLAEIVGVSVRTIQSYEANKITPPVDNLKKIAEALDVNVNTLMNIDDKVKNIIKAFNPNNKSSNELEVEKNKLENIQKKLYETEQILMSFGLTQTQINSLDISLLMELRNFLILATKIKYEELLKKQSAHDKYVEDLQD